MAANMIIFFISLPSLSLSLSFSAERNCASSALVKFMIETMSSLREIVLGPSILDIPVTRSNADINSLSRV